MIDNKGTWIWFSGLPADLSERDLASFFSGFGLSIKPENINLKRFSSSCNAVISISPRELAAFLNARIGGLALHGKPVTAVPFADRPRNSAGAK